jgi:putative toxin-antitoxin system antitoxin component (TIGR02293 family)
MAATALSQIPLHDHRELSKLVSLGLPASAFKAIAQRLHLTPADLATQVHLAPRTIARRLAAGSRLKPTESQAAVRVGRLVRLAEEVFEDRDAAADWFHRPLAVLGGKTPLELCGDEHGAREVEQVLGRIEHGVFG